ncbi:hypothetical protein GM3708_2069 [Geminocystis sp. NIES-3708]|uniref:hypothetical protein n=1 Tax=Geminocystis sp. NIES-3708 TaxID=1615909 RepID=UPI0005FCDC2F|nr:hypothetical protein [Geminocystis sp. NIES-3708]BAQ61663.1 hypothetical protein GM3708_2069 [Geminocystis sp. NIES-3708]
MFNFTSLRINKNSKDNFVGIKKNIVEDCFEFYLPIGFDEFPEEDFDLVRKLFFDLYRTFRKFENDNIDNEKFQLNNSEYQQDQDQTTTKNGGVTLTNNQQESCIIYSKIRMLENILEAYDPLIIQSLKDKIRASEKIKYSDIHKYLYKAIYLKNDVIFIDTMDLASPTLENQSTDIVTLYCYILDEIIEQLDGDVSEQIKDHRQEIKFLSETFQDNYLTNHQSIFDSETSLETISILKETLENIDKNTHYKDNNYWQLYEAIELFLYGEINPEGEDGEYWGIKGFSFVWEDMCHTYFFKNCFDNIAYADTDICIKKYHNDLRDINKMNRVGNHLISAKDKNNQIWIYQTASPVKSFNKKYLLNWQDLLLIKYDLEPVIFVYSNPIYTKRNFKQELPRLLRPDLLLNYYDEKSKKNTIIIYDYKYVNLEFYVRNNNIPLANTNDKYRIDLIKELTYEFALQQSQDLTISKNCYLIPQFFHEYQNTIFQDLLQLKEGIIVQSVDFSLIQKSYLEENS